MAERRSTRTRETGNKLEKAQQLQKKNNLEEQQGKNNSSKVLNNKVNVNTLAKIVGVKIGKDLADQSRILNDISICNENRKLDLINSCPHVDCKVMNATNSCSSSSDREMLCVVSLLV